MSEGFAGEREKCCAVDPGFLLQEFSDWLYWMKREVTVCGIDLPSDEMCVLFAASSVGLADRVHKIYSHVPRSLRTKLIQAAILHRCWTHHVEFRRKGSGRDVVSGGLPVLDALDLSGASTSADPSVVATDGHNYKIRFPRPAPRDMELATEVICFLLAREMGLRVPEICAVRVKPQIASRVGILGRARQHGGLVALGSGDFCCLGVRHVDEAVVDHEGNPLLPLGPAGARHLAGAVTFHVLTLGAVSEKRVFRDSNGHVEPIFTDFRHSLMNANWPRFVRATYRQRVAYSCSAKGISSYEQLEPWLRRAGRVNVERICETVVKLPGDWYQGNPMAVVGVLEKLRERVGNLRRTILNLVDRGFFVAMKKPSSSRRVPRRAR